jgi:glycerol kinase
VTGTTASRLFLCLDQGGHASRALVVDEFGAVVAKAFIAIDTLREGQRVEHDPEQLVGSLLQAAEQAVAQAASTAGQLVAAGLATQRSSIVCWDKDTGKPLSPVISWQDTRALDWAEGFHAQQQRVHELTGLVVSPYYGFSKLRWCLDNLPAVQAALAAGTLRCGPLAAFLAQRLTGCEQLQVDPANASRTLLWDRNTLDWSPELLKLFGIPREVLPDCVASRHAWGELQINGQRLPLQVVTGDQSAALFAFGRPDPQSVFMNLGTGAFLQRIFAAAQPADLHGLLNSVVYQDGDSCWTVLEGTVNGAGSALANVANELALPQEYMQQHSADWLQQQAGAGLFLNTVSGLGSPWWLAGIAAEFVSLQEEPLSDEQKIAAVLESIAFLIATNLEAMTHLAGAPERLLVTGGLGAVEPLLQVIANVAGIRVERARSVEATAHGLGCLLAGLPEAWPQAHITSYFEPQHDPEVNARFLRWRQLMPAIRN